MGGRQFKCKLCEYASSRRFNVERHAGRIHGAAKRAPICKTCGLKFPAKDTYYVHMERVHPGARIKRMISRNVYKITERDEFNAEEKKEKNNQNGQRKSKHRKKKRRSYNKKRTTEDVQNDVKITEEIKMNNANCSLPLKKRIIINFYPTNMVEAEENENYLRFLEKVFERA